MPCSANQWCTIRLDGPESGKIKECWRQSTCANRFIKVSLGAISSKGISPNDKNFSSAGKSGVWIAIAASTSCCITLLTDSAGSPVLNLISTCGYLCRKLSNKPGKWLWLAVTEQNKLSSPWSCWCSCCNSHFSFFHSLKICWENPRSFDPAAVSLTLRLSRTNKVVPHSSSSLWIERLKVEGLTNIDSAVLLKCKLLAKCWNSSKLRISI